MLCTNCSTPIKPVVALDVDGTLGDYHGHFLQYASGYLGVDVLPDRDIYDGNPSFKDWFCTSFEVSSSQWYDIKLAYRQGAMKRTMPAYPGCGTLARYVQRIGAELWITTSRPYNRLDNIDPDTREWLARNYVTFDHLIYDDDKYKILAEMVDPSRVVAVLDDLWEMYDAASIQFGPMVPILRRTTYNRAIQRPNAISDLNRSAVGVVKNRINNWKREHA